MFNEIRDANNVIKQVLYIVNKGLIIIHRIATKAKILFKHKIDHARYPSLHTLCFSRALSHSLLYIAPPPPPFQVLREHLSKGFCRVSSVIQYNNNKSKLLYSAELMAIFICFMQNHFLKIFLFYSTHTIHI